MPYSLTWRQKKLYTHRCDIWSVTRNANTDGKGTPGADVLTKVETDVPCFYRYNPNIDDVSEAGRMNRSTLFTTDMIFFPIGVNVDSGYWVKNTSPGNANAGQVHRILGSPQIVPGSPSRPVNQQSAEAMVEEKPPAGIT